MKRGRERERGWERREKRRKTAPKRRDGAEKKNGKKRFFFFKRLFSLSTHLERRDAGVDRLRRRVLDLGLGVAGRGAGRLAGLGRGLELGAEGLLGGLCCF